MPVIFVFLSVLVFCSIGESVLLGSSSIEIQDYENFLNMAREDLYPPEDDKWLMLTRVSRSTWKIHASGVTYQAMLDALPDDNTALVMIGFLKSGDEYASNYVIPWTPPSAGFFARMDTASSVDQLKRVLSNESNVRLRSSLPAAGDLAGMQKEVLLEEINKY